MAGKKKELVTDSVDEQVQGSLSHILADSLNKKFKSSNHKVAFILDEDPAADVTDWVSTGNSMLDLAISNRPNGGFPVGRITEITGLEACVTEDTIIEVIID
jgi:hypothetical protein